MNRTALNGGAIGTGSALPWVSGAAQQLFRLTSAASVGLTKYGKAAGSFALNGALATANKFYASATQAMSFVGDLTEMIWHQRREQLSGTMAVSSTATGHIRKYASAAQSMVLAPTVDVTVWHRVHSDSLPASMRMTWTAVGVDLATSAAPEERTTGIIDLTNMPRTADTIPLGA